MLLIFCCCRAKYQKETSGKKQEGRSDEKLFTEKSNLINSIHQQPHDLDFLTITLICKVGSDLCHLAFPNQFFFKFVLLQGVLSL